MLHVVGQCLIVHMIKSKHVSASRTRNVVGVTHPVENKLLTVWKQFVPALRAPQASSFLL